MLKENNNVQNVIKSATENAEAIIDGDRTYSSVPHKLKTKVAQVLEEKGSSELVTE